MGNRDIVHAFILGGAVPADDPVGIVGDIPAYGVHHLYDRDQDHLIEILAECKRAGNPDLIVQVDGGVDRTTATACGAAGADCLVAGSAVFGKADYAAETEAIRSAATHK